MRLLVGTRKGLVVYEKSGSTWKVVGDHFLGIPVSLVYCDESTGIWWAALDHGHWGIKLHVSDDEGESWTELEAPKFPVDAALADDQAASLNYIWALQSTGRGDGSLWIGTVPGGLFEWKDGKSQLNRSLWDDPTRKEWFGGGMDQPGIHSIEVDPDNPDELYIGISCGGVYKSSDGGKSWAIKNKGLRADFLPDPYSEVGHDPHLLVASKADRNVMWQQNHCGIFQSSDRGDTWQDVSMDGGPAHFGFAVAVDDQNPQRAWVAPAISDVVRAPVDKALCICRTDDGGKTWQVFRDGLPQYSFDIVYRHGLIADQNDVVFGTTTGNLYASGDAGEKWDLLSANLAMVYSLTFAH